MGKSNNPFSFRRSNSNNNTTRRRKTTTTKKTGESQLLLPGNTPSPSPPPPPSQSQNNNVLVAKPKKKGGGARLWMRFDRFGESELFECDKTTIIKRAGIPARDLRILGPVFSNSSNILGIPSFLTLFRLGLYLYSTKH